jgi:hypothetical protein
MHVHICKYVDADECVCMYTYVRVCVHMYYASMHMYYACMHTYIHTHTYIYMYTYKHTHICMYVYTYIQKPPYARG